MLTLKNDTGQIDFDSNDYVLTSVDFGSIDATHTTAKGAGQTGERLINTSLDTRSIEIVGFIRAKNAADMMAKKAELHQMCDPRKPFQVLPDDSLSLTCNTTATVKFSSSKLLNNDSVAQFVIDAECFDPLFADAVARYRKIAEWASNFIWPLSIPSTGFTFADRNDSLITTLTNSGDVETGMLIHFTASATVVNPALTNIDTGEFIRINRTFVAGETVVINTNYGQESAYSYIGDSIQNVINSVDLDSTFLQAPVGVSNLHFKANTNTTSMTVTIYFHQKYLGV